MDSILQADIFFFITSIAVVVLTSIFAVGGIYLVQAFRSFRDVSRIVKRGAENAEENIEEAYHELEDSTIFRLIFGRRRSRGTRKKKSD